METNGTDDKNLNNVRQLKNYGPVFPSKPQLINLQIVRDRGLTGTTVQSYGTWHIEGEFLITYGSDGARAAYKIPSDTKVIYERRNEKDAQR